MKTYDKFKKELTEDGMLHGETGLRIRQHYILWSQ